MRVLVSKWWFRLSNVGGWVVAGFKGLVGQWWGKIVGWLIDADRRWLVPD